MRGDPTSGRLGLFATLAAALAFACGRSETAIVIEVASALPAGAVDRVVIGVSGMGLEGGAREARVDVDGPNAKSFPLSLALVRDEGNTGTAFGPFAVTIIAEKAGATRARGASMQGDGPIAFESGRVVRRRYDLRLDGAPPLGDAGATPGSPDTGAGEATDAGAPPDAAAPAVDAPATPAADAVPPAALPETAPPACLAGCACGARCAPGVGGCACPTACTCPLACDGDDCEAKCGETKGSCLFESALGGVAVRCEGATCKLESKGGGSEISCKEGPCEVTCTGGESCVLKCTNQAQCLFRCDSGTCALKDCTERLTRCPGGVLVCNRPCP